MRQLAEDAAQQLNTIVGSGVVGVAAAMRAAVEQHSFAIEVMRERLRDLHVFGPTISADLLEAAKASQEPALQAMRQYHEEAAASFRTIPAERLEPILVAARKALLETAVLRFVPSLRALQGSLGSVMVPWLDSSNMLASCMGAAKVMTLARAS